ncbi:hypothetical protein TrST_g4191 [Triparma strigata]|uniref:Uncharacterized protein n=1 Tax=Triparma strigata TaxID=1606541 RepID=A0A9W7A9G4_9STRA|nr:hypothetical protein TrST_g4191 [Triparma strigata]
MEWPASTRSETQYTSRAAEGGARHSSNPKNYANVAHRAVIGHSSVEYVAQDMGGLRSARTSSRKSEIHSDFLKSFKPSQTSFHPGGKGLEFVGQPSTRELYAELDWGSQTYERLKPTRAIGKQILSKNRNATSFRFGKDTIPDEFGGRGAFAKMPMSYGTMSPGMLNDMDHIKTRPHCYDTRAYGTCLGAANASWEHDSKHVEPPRVRVGKAKRDINPLAWGRR